MNIQYILKTMATIGLVILTALYEGMMRFGLGVLGLPFPEDTQP